MLNEWSDRIEAQRPRRSRFRWLAPAFLLLAAIAIILATGADSRPRKKSARRSHAPKSSAHRAVSAAGATYRSCAAARAAGVTPIRRGDPGYSRRLDRDGDGVACE